MTDIRRFTTAIFSAAILTLGSYHAAFAYSNDASSAAPATPTAPAAAATSANTSDSNSTTPATGVASPADFGQAVQTMDASKTIGQNIAGSSNFATFSKLLAATGLDTILNGGGPLIVFAPDDAAFAAIPADQLTDLMKPENKDKLSKILSYHISNGNLSLKDVQKLGMTGNAIPLRTNEGGNINLQKDKDTSQGDKWDVLDETGATASITQPDQKTSNGKIYVIDKVLMPKM